MPHIETSWFTSKLRVKLPKIGAHNLFGQTYIISSFHLFHHVQPLFLALKLFYSKSHMLAV